MADPLLEPATITRRPEYTSFGDVEIQIRNVSSLLGKGTKKITFSNQRRIIKLLESEQFNLAVAAEYVSTMLGKVYPDYQLEDFDDYKIMLSGYMYNMGYPHKLLGACKNLEIPRMKGISSYGHDLLKKRERMLELLGLKQCSEN